MLTRSIQDGRISSATLASRLCRLCLYTYIYLTSLPAWSRQALYVWSSALHAPLPFWVLARAVKRCMYGAVLCMHPCRSGCWRELSSVACMEQCSACTLAVLGFRRCCIELCSACLYVWSCALHGGFPSLQCLEDGLVVMLGRWVVNGVVGNVPITST